MASRKEAWGTNVALTNAIASLGSSSTWVAGYESDVTDNTTNLLLDYRVTGKVTVGTTPTINTEIRIYVVGIWGDVTTWPDVFDGTTGAETVTSVGVGTGFLKLGAVMLVDATTSDRPYPFDFTVAQLYGGVVPEKFVLFTTHNTGVALNATGGNHVFNVRGLYETVV